MPVYEYACGKCDHEFEVEQRISDAPVKTCPRCRSRKVKRLISQTSFVLKGGGWYSDLYATPKQDKKAAADETKTGGDGSDKDKGKGKGKDGGAKTGPESDGAAKSGDSGKKGSGPSGAKAAA